MRGREAGISIETQVGAINLTAAILVLFPVNLKQMRVILAIIRRGEETTEHYADRVPSSAAKCHRFKDPRIITQSSSSFSFVQWPVPT